MRHTRPLLLPQPCRSHAHLGNDRTVPNPCFLSPNGVHSCEDSLPILQTTTYHLAWTQQRLPTGLSMLSGVARHRSSSLLISTVSTRSLPSQQEDAHTSS